MNDNELRDELVWCVQALLEERQNHMQSGDIVQMLPQAENWNGMFLKHADADLLWTAFRALVNTRMPWEASSEFLEHQDRLLQELIARDGITSVDGTTPSPFNSHLRLWRGDITRIATDAIVNAANSQMLGCWRPGHHCIDNAIQTFAGVQLRIELSKIMMAQGHEEPTAQAKVTGAYNLPSHSIIHTVGPIANGRPNRTHKKQLRQCYRSCLDAAAAQALHSIAFCCISTGDRKSVV